MSRGRAATAGKNIHLLRSLRSLKQRDLAEAIGVDRSAVANWENGRYLPAEDCVAKMQVLFKADRDVILGRKPLRYELSNIKWTGDKPGKSGTYLAYVLRPDGQKKYMLLDYDHALNRWEEKGATYINPATGRQIDAYHTFDGQVLQWTAFPRSDCDTDLPVRKRD